MWFTDPENLDQIVDRLDVSIDAYESAINEVLELFPLSWAKAQEPRSREYAGWIGIHPPFFRWLDFHPIARFMMQKPFNAIPTLTPIVRLGMDLIRTKRIPRIQALRQELLSLDQYAGRLFELEILSRFVTEGLSPSIIGTPDFCVPIDGQKLFLEARHRGAPFWMNTSFGIYLPMQKDWPPIRVQLNYVSGVKDESFLLRAAIEKDLEELDPNDLLLNGAIVRAKYTISHEPSAPAGIAMIVGYGPDKPWSSEVETLIFQTLVEKAPQLKSASADGSPCAIVIDCRSIIPPDTLETSGPWYERRNAIKAGILRAGDRFLTENKWISGVIWWWKTAIDPWKADQIVKQQWPVTISTGSLHLEGPELGALCRKLFN